MLEGKFSLKALVPSGSQRIDAQAIAERQVLMPSPSKMNHDMKMMRTVPIVPTHEPLPVSQ